MARVIVVDDEPRLRAAIRTYLRRQGHEILEAENGVELLRLLSEGEPVDLVITDINMPEMDGIEVLNALEESYPGLPVIAISGGGLLEKDLLLDNADAMGAVRTLAKPFELTDLDRVVAESLSERDRPE